MGKFVAKYRPYEDDSDDYDTKTYEYFDIKQENKRVGVKGSPIIWYEYISR